MNYSDLFLKYWTNFNIQLCKICQELKASSLKIDHICVGFCEDLAIEFDPKILGPKLLTFVKLENKIRTTIGLRNLLTNQTHILKIRKNLYNELDKALNN
ncbi:MAG: hypothetical protein KGD63_15425 [Candidatus Lokiarchaeota archaeon]|nr:hypothetical protein [Candidatus Lokiarchaeota archaeon]